MQCRLMRAIVLRVGNVHTFTVMTAPQAQTQTWSTLGGKDAFVHWREVVCQAFTKLSPERIDRSPFAGEVRLSPIGNQGTVSQITASPQTVARGRREVAESPCDAVFVNIQVAGTSVVSQRGMQASLAPGSFVLLDARQPFHMRFDKAFKQVCLHLPMDWLESHDFDPACAMARTVDRSHIYGGALWDSVDFLLDEPQATGATDYLMHLLRLCYGDGGADTLADKHLKHIRAFIRQECADPAMTPRAVADHFRISVRHLHRLFARGGQSFGEYLLHCRLHQARLAVLLEPEHALTDIGQAAGFADASHFSRSFRRRYGLSPSAMRKRAGAR